MRKRKSLIYFAKYHDTRISCQVLVVSFKISLSIIRRPYKLPFPLQSTRVMTTQIADNFIFVQQVVPAKNNENIKAMHY